MPQPRYQIELPDLPAVIDPPTAPTENLQHINRATHGVYAALKFLCHLAALERQTPEMHSLQINPGNNGQYIVLDKSPWPAKSIGVLNPGAAPVFIGVGGVSARPLSGAPSCPGASALVLPVEAQDLELGCDPAVLADSTAEVFLFRYVTVQPLVLRQVP